MANATEIQIHNLSANASIEAPTAQVLDTGGDPVVLETTVPLDFGRLFLEVTNTAADDLVVTVSPGESPPAWQSNMAGLGLSATLAQNVSRLFGPFESARYTQADGKLSVTFTPSAGTVAATFTAFMVPKV